MLSFAGHIYLGVIKLENGLKQAPAPETLELCWLAQGLVLIAFYGDAALVDQAIQHQDNNRHRPILIKAFLSNGFKATGK